jgi:hypothetical protein
MRKDEAQQLEHGIYRLYWNDGYGRTISDQLHMKLNDYYGFDDSE